jgi:hypothetical protein
VSALSQILVLPAVKEKYSMKLQEATIKPAEALPDSGTSGNSTAGNSTANETCAIDDYTCNG